MARFALPPPLVRPCRWSSTSSTSIRGSGSDLAAAIALATVVGLPPGGRHAWRIRSAGGRDAPSRPWSSTSAKPTIARALAPSANVQVSAQRRRARPFAPARATRRIAARVVFCGVMNYAPNDQGMRWFVNEVWPLVKRSRPDATLAIVGADPRRSLKAHVRGRSVDRSHAAECPMSATGCGNRPSESRRCMSPAAFRTRRSKLSPRACPS